MDSKKCSGEKLSKICITGMAATNATGHKLPIFIAGKVIKPRWFKKIKRLPCCFRNQEKNYMEETLFEEWVRYLEEKFASQEINVPLVINNCLVHHPFEIFKAIKLFFQPSNTTSKAKCIKV